MKFQKEMMEVAQGLGKKIIKEKLRYGKKNE